MILLCSSTSCAFESFAMASAVETIASINCTIVIFISLHIRVEVAGGEPSAGNTVKIFCIN